MADINENNINSQSEKKCSCGGNCNCGGHNHNEHGDGHCKCAGNSVQNSDEEWIKSLKKKIKDKIQPQNGEQLDKLAEIIAVASAERWNNKTN